MTSSRIVRGTKTRVLLYVVAVVVLTGFLACFNSTRLELDKVLKTNELCQQEQENLGTQLQMISDYKQRLEKTHKSEKAECQQAKAKLEQRINEEKLRGEKTADDATSRFNSLQQQYNILKTDHTDLKEKCSKMQNDQMVQINDLELKLKEVQEQLKQTERDKENSMEFLKIQIEQLKSEKLAVETQLKSDPSKAELLELKKELAKYKPPSPRPSSRPLASENKTSFDKLVAIDSNDYRIDVGGAAETQNFLQKPNSANSKTSTPANALGSSKADLNLAAPLKIPTATPDSTVKNRTTSTETARLPEGVVRQPAHRDAVADLVNNRYMNVARDAEKTVMGEDRNEIEKENGAREVMDFPEDEFSNNELKEGGVANQHPVAIVEKDRDYENYDNLPQNDDLQENEEDEDPDDIANHRPEKEVIVRN